MSGATQIPIGKNSPTRFFSWSHLLTPASWHLLSLDAPTVAVTWLLAFAWSARVHLPLWIPVVIATGTWGVYLLDRIFDASSALKRNQESELRLRHRFHWNGRRILLPLGLCLVALAFCLAWRQMPPGARLRNSWLTAAALAYFCGVHAQGFGLTLARWSWLKNFKEFFVALIFTAACVLPTLARVDLNIALLTTPALFVALAWLNCHAIESWESHSARNMKLLAVMPLLLALAAFACALFFLRINLRLAALDCCLCFSSLLIAALNFYRTKFSPLGLRVAADLALLTPSVLLFFRSAQW